MDYPRKKDYSFLKEIRNIFGRYKIHKETRSAKELCYPKQYKLQKPQNFVADYINPKTPYRDLLIFHQIGAGKTCASIQIAEKWKKRRRILVVVPASLIGNYRNELRSLCAGNEYLSEKERKTLKNISVRSREYQDIIKKSDKKINKYYKIISYQKFIILHQNRRLKLDNTLVIIDEVQNIVSETGSMYKYFYKTLTKMSTRNPIILLSATPMFDKPSEIALTLNLLRIPKKLPTGKEFNEMFLEKVGDKYKIKNLDILKKASNGVISYYRGAHPKTFPKKNIIYVDCKMSEFQYRSYVSVLAKEGSFTKSDIFAVPNNFFISSRSISNIAFPNKKMRYSGYQSLKKRHLKSDQLKIYSRKFYNLLKNIKKSKGPVFIYSNFKEFAGIKTFSRILETYGYKNYERHGPGNKRFSVWSGDQSLKYRDEMKSIFNKPENKHGKLIKIIMGTPAIKEGVTLLRVEQAHILEPYWNISRMEQIMGRAIRYCSHKDLPAKDRKVSVYLYRSVHPDLDISIDQYIYQLADRKQDIISRFEMLLKQNAVDCSLNIIANNVQNKQKIKCFKKN